MILLGKYCEYIGEGNAHIVLRVAETSYVVRLIKEHNETVDIRSIEISIAFVNNVMIPLLSDGNYDKYDVIELKANELSEICVKLEAVRPQKRKHKSKLSTFAVKAPNLLVVNPQLSSNYCVEIKPKEGFISSSLKGSNKCYYCLKQFLKLSEKQIDKVSEYCPLDLFSGDRTRMRRALLNLIENPQNNLKFFNNEQIIYGEKSSPNEFNHFLDSIDIFKSSINLFLDFIIDILIYASNKSHSTCDKSNDTVIKKSIGKCTEDKKLPSDSFLIKLLEIQKWSETFYLEKCPINVKNKEYVPLILDKIEAQNLDLNNATDIQKFISSTDPQHLALISAVAKDCSIMISFSLDTYKELPSVKIGDAEISYRLAVTDLEPKSAKSLVNRKETERKMLEAYFKYMDTVERSDLCKIQPHSETRAKQLEAWETLIIEYLKASKQSMIDVRESQNSPLFNNSSINRKLSQESIVTILEDMAKAGKAAPIDKSKAVWEVYWHSLDEWGNIVYNWACSNGLNNSVCTLFELREGDNSVGEEFHGLDMNILIKALKTLQVKGKCELMEFDDNQGVKFF